MKARWKVALTVLALGLSGGAIALWPLGYRKHLRSWWYWRNGPHHGRFQDPEALGVDEEGNVYVGDEKRNRLLVLDARGETRREVVGLEGLRDWLAPGRLAVLGPSHIVLISGDDLVELVAEGDRLRPHLLASPDAGAPFEAPEGVAWDARSGHLYVSDEDARQVVVLAADGRHVRSFPVLDEPEALHVYEDRLYVTLPKVSLVGCYSLEGELRFSFGDDRLDVPDFVLVSPDRKLYVTDSGRHRVEVFDLDGRHFFTIGGPGSEPGRFASPQDLAFDPDGNLLVADSNNHRVQVLTPAGGPVRILE